MTLLVIFAWYIRRPSLIQHCRESRMFLLRLVAVRGEGQFSYCEQLLLKDTSEDEEKKEMKTNFNQYLSLARLHAGNWKGWSEGIRHACANLFWLLYLVMATLFSSDHGDLAQLWRRTSAPWDHISPSFSSTWPFGTCVPCSCSAFSEPSLI